MNEDTDRLQTTSSDSNASAAVANASEIPVDKGLTWALIVGLSVYYGLLISERFTYGDGPELLVAAHGLGVSHPSGYPLFTLLAHLVQYLPGADYFSVSFFLSALPTAAAAALLFRTLRAIQLGPSIAFVGALGWATMREVVYQASRVEVYGLHCFWVSLSLYFLVRLEREREVRWLWATVAAICLGLTNHLTSAFLILPAVLAFFWISPALVLCRKTIGVALAIAGSCASIYAYLPLAAMFPDSHAVYWNDPQTWERFWFHVTGKEYSIFRDYSAALPFLERFLRSLEKTYFPGVLLIGGLGLWEWWTRSKKSALFVTLFAGSMLFYLSTYKIGDLSTYYPALYLPLTACFALGLGWLARVRLDAASKVSAALHGVLVLVFLCGISIQAYRGVSNAYVERLAEDMSEQVMDDIEGPALVFSSVDAHTFPMWYQTLVRARDRKVVVVDRVLFRLANKEWYRAYLRRHAPWVVWPTTEVATQKDWEAWLIEHNPEVRFYGLLQQPWRSRGSHPVLRGWHHEIVRGARPAGQKAPMVRHLYSSEFIRFRGRPYFVSSTLEYDGDRLRSEGRAIACVADWWKHGGVTATWTFRGPEGQEVVIADHRIPKSSNVSWELLEPKDQAKGRWTCEVSWDDGQRVEMSFVIR